MDIHPAQYPFRTVTLAFAAILFSWLSLRFLRYVNSGSTVIYHSVHFFTTFKVVSGKVPLNSRQKNSGFIRHYHGPAASALLGLLTFSAAEFLLVLIFRQ